jgi:hypothetical protein
MNLEMTNMKKILVPLPAYGFDSTEVAIPSKLLSTSNFEIVYATPVGIFGTALRTRLEDHAGLTFELIN